MSYTFSYINNPVMTSHGLITGVTLDGNLVFTPNPVINFMAGLPPQQTCQQTETISINQLWNQREHERAENAKRREAFQKKDKVEEQIQIEKNRVDELEKKLMAQKIKQDEINEIDRKLLSEKLHREFTEKQLETERKNYDELKKKFEVLETKINKQQADDHVITHDRLDKFNSLMQRMALNKHDIQDDIQDDISTVSSVKSSRSTRSTSTDSTSMYAPSTVISDVDHLYNDDSVSINSDRTIINDDEIDEWNPNIKSKYATCNGCEQCYFGTRSVGCIFIDTSTTDIKFVLGFSSSEGVYCDVSSKLKIFNHDTRQIETPYYRATKLVASHTTVEYEMNGNDFIDIPIKDNLHVHRVFIINWRNDLNLDIFKKNNKTSRYGMFSLKSTDDNYESYNNKKLINNNGIICNINKRVQKFIDIFYHLYF